ncbi:MAG: L,D-transpeptidase [Bacillus sp. (in: firmicutes)]
MDDEKELIAQEEQQKQDNEIIDWNAPSNGSYPTLDKSKSIWIDVSVNDQKVYIKDGDATLYTMTASTGIDTNDDNSTPKGIYYIEPERGEWFFSSGYGEGAEYWVSWKNHGEFLFHSVPMNGNKQVIEEEAKKLGEKASHGCIRLTIADAKWIYEHIQTNTKVVIRS